MTKTLLNGFLEDNVQSKPLPTQYKDLLPTIIPDLKRMIQK